MRKKRTRAEKRALIQYHFGNKPDAVEFGNLILLDAARNELATVLSLHQRMELERRIYEQQLQPPRLAEFLLTLFANSEHGESACGDLNERYSREHEAFGTLRAKRLYWARALRSLWPLLCRVVGRAVKWGVILSIKRFLG
jgi:hypothetical protein